MIVSQRFFSKKIYCVICPVTVIANNFLGQFEIVSLDEDIEEIYHLPFLSLTSKTDF